LFFLNSNKIIGNEAYSIYEKMILLIINRKTLGFNKKSDKISISQFVKFGSMSKDTILRNIKVLESKKLIVVSRGKGQSISRYKLNYSFFCGSCKRLQKGLVVAESDTQYIERNNNKNSFFSKRDIKLFIKYLIATNPDIRNSNAYTISMKRNFEREDKQTIEEFNKWQRHEHPYEHRDYIEKFYV